MKLLPPFCAALFLTAAVQADTTARFQWSPAEFSTLEGIVSAHQRIEQTARAFCSRHLHGTRGAGRNARCVDAVMGEIVSEVNDQRLTAYATTGRVDEALLAKR